LGLGLVLWWRWGTRGRSEAPTSALGGADDEGEGGPRTGPDGPGSVASGPGESAPTFVELVRAPTVRNEPSGAPIENAATLQADRSNGDLDSAELSNLGVEVPPISTSAPPEPRLKLSQRVMLHLYLQGHLADGEVAPMGFTQGGMADKLAAAQSPLSSVLRRLVVAGLVTQDTRHVRGQPRRLRVYRLTSVGEVVARDLYRDSLAEDRAGPNVD
ncbi:MAG: MarR family winged helix-turn-helix transcriptional regulator, partial [Thermoplasmata archaeon]|nr:MarR family winged helix-turn-helix transcriptional regulator [Thermoplasmata archaeon]